MPHGTIKNLALDKGFGFIEPADGSTDVFFHRSATGGDFEAFDIGQPVQFELDERSDKPRASLVLSTAGAATDRRPPARSPRADSVSHRRELSRRSIRPPAASHFGFVTKIYRGTRHGFISSTQGGPELLFEAAQVIGDKRFSEMEPGEYVRYEVVTMDVDPKQPQATAVMAVERRLELPEKRLPRHPRARRRKPTWRRSDPEPTP